MSREKRFTRGPWQIERLANGEVMIVGDVRTIDGDCDEVTAVVEAQMMSHANAHLIKSAPKLLEALEACEDYFDGCAVDGIDDPHESATAAAEKVRAAITEAYGENQ